MEEIIGIMVVIGLVLFKTLLNSKKALAETDEPSAQETDWLPAESETPIQQPQTGNPWPEEGVRTTAFHHAKTRPSKARPGMEHAERQASPAEDSTDSPWSIHNAEEARRAIIWSEIIQRKY